MGEDRTYIQNLARQFMGEIGIKVSDYRHHTDKTCPQALFAEHGGHILKTLNGRFRNGTLGEIVACGYGSNPQGWGVSLEAVHAGPFLYSYQSGKARLVMLAATTVVAEIASIIRKRLSLAAATRQLDNVEKLDKLEAPIV